MGDRAVIGFKETRESTPIWLYSHWGGSNRFQDVQRALEAARPRWNDPSYATRIAVSQIIGDDWSGELNYGLTTDDDIVNSSEYDVIIVIWDERTVEVHTIENLNEGVNDPDLIGGFDAFIFSDLIPN